MCWAWSFGMWDLESRIEGHGNMKAVSFHAKALAGNHTPARRKGLEHASHNIKAPEPKSTSSGSLYFMR